MNVRKLIAIVLVVTLAMGVTGVTYAKWSDKLPGRGKVHTAKKVHPPGSSVNDCFSWVVSNDNGTEEYMGGYTPTDPGDNGLDPSENQSAGVPCAREVKDIASTTAILEADPHYITATVYNAYPGYFPTIFYGLENNQTFPVKIESIVLDEDAITPGIQTIPELTVIYNGIPIGECIGPGEEVSGFLSVLVEQIADYNAEYIIRLRIYLVQCVEDHPGVLLPTGVACSDYRSGDWPPMYDHFEYGVKNSHINNVSPGAFFYYNTIVAPSADFTVEVVQTNSSNWKPILVLGDNPPQAYVYTGDCDNKVAFGTGSGNPDYTVTFNVTGATAGATYYIGIKYKPNSLKDQPVSPGDWSEYFFETRINGIFHPGSGDSTTVLPKP